MAAKRCPSCNLVNPGSAMTCDCGYSFVTGAQGRPLDVQSQRPQAMVTSDPGRAARLLIALGVGILIAVLRLAMRH